MQLGKCRYNNNYSIYTLFSFLLVSTCVTDNKEEKQNNLLLAVYAMHAYRLTSYINLLKRYFSSISIILILKSDIKKNLYINYVK